MPSCRLPIAMAILLSATSGFAQAPNEVRIDNETVPSGGVVQLKMALTDPTGKMTARFDSEFFDSIENIHLFSRGRDLMGAALVNGTAISVGFNSVAPARTAARGNPLLTVGIRTKPGIAPRSRQ